MFGYMRHWLKRMDFRQANVPELMDMAVYFSIKSAPHPEHYDIVILISAIN